MRAMECTSDAEQVAIVKKMRHLWGRIKTTHGRGVVLNIADYPAVDRDIVTLTWAQARRIATGADWRVVVGKVEAR